MSSDINNIYHFEINADSYKLDQIYDIHKEKYDPLIDLMVENITVDKTGKYMVLYGLYVVCYDISNPNNISFLWYNSEHLDFESVDSDIAGISLAII